MDTAQGTSRTERYYNAEIARGIEQARAAAERHQPTAFGRGAASRRNPTGPYAMPAAERARLLNAACYASRAYPGPVGELIQREIEAFLEFGYRFTGGALLARLTDQVLADPHHLGSGVDGPPATRDLPQAEA